MIAVTLVAAVLAWVGATMLVLGEGPRAIAAGLGVYAIGAALALSVRPAYAAALGAAGMAAAGLRYRSAAGGWGGLPPAATPRIILCLVTGGLGAFVAGALMPAPGSPAARTALVVGGFLVTARLLTTGRRSAALASSAALAITAGGVAALIDGPSAPVAVATAALGTIGLGLIPSAEARDGA